MEKQTFYSNGKLLITGEYLVLKGALALAVPTVLGQEMVVRGRDRERERGSEGVIRWKSYYMDRCWFEGEFSVPDAGIISSSDNEKAGFIARLLDTANKMNPDHLSGRDSHKVETRLGFDPNWGLGSSSSLTNLIADWFHVDPWELFIKTQTGSGYDITCARVLNPIWFRRSIGVPISQKVAFSPDFKDKLAFVYRGKKQDSTSSVQQFLESKEVYDDEVVAISEISRELPTAKTIMEFNSLLEEHEEIMSQVLGQKKVKESFPDFPGCIKSLGAWGGDFILATHKSGMESIKSYFSKKGLNVVFSYDELIKYE